MTEIRGNFMHRVAAALFTAATTLTLAACSSEPEPVDPAAQADAFAKRIGSSAPASGSGTAEPVPPRIAETLPGAAPGPFNPGTLTDPASAKCGANQMGPFLGKLADEPTRLEIVKTVGRSDNVRFVVHGSGGFINPDPTSPRLNLMLDAQNIIRDARCG